MQSPKHVYSLGISAYYHDSAAALLRDGEILAAAQEERFTRKKHDSGFPAKAIDYCLREAKISFSEISHVTFYDKPLLKFERLLETYLGFAPKGFSSFLKAMPVWLREKLFLKAELDKQLGQFTGKKTLDHARLLFTDHHHSHAASAFFPSPFENAAVLCVDGVGEWDTLSVWEGRGNTLRPVWKLDFPHSLGLLYSAFTYYAGFKVNSGEYKLMGLAPYGSPKYVDLILKHLIDVKSDGTFRLNMDYFNYPVGLTMTGSKFEQLFGGPRRKPESPVTQKEMDLAASIQKVTEGILLKIASSVRQELGMENLCLAGGVALNCVANGRLLRESAFENIWIQPAAGDAGGALGAALATWHQYLGRDRRPMPGDGMKGSYLGPEHSTDESAAALTSLGATFDSFSDGELCRHVAGLIARENVIGWFQGRMEFGPRALGNRSILGDPRSPRMQSQMNLKIKYRESFRPFAPSVLAEDVEKYFAIDRCSPYMLLVAQIQDGIKLAPSPAACDAKGIDLLKIPRSTLPAVTHVDYSARVQTVHPETNPRYYDLLSEFKKLTGCGVLINTSFNVRGEPPVCSVEDAYRCFMRTEMDYLVVGNHVLEKKRQAVLPEDETWKTQFELD